MTKKMQLIFIIVTLTMLFSVGIVQAIVEMKRGESIQILDIFTDTFITPYRYIERRQKLFEDLAGKLGEVKMVAIKGRDMQSPNVAVKEAGISPWNPKDAQVIAENARIFASQLSSSVDSVNRYKLWDTTSAFYRDMRALSNELSGYYENFKNIAAEPNELVLQTDMILTRIDELDRLYLRPGFLKKLWIPMEYFFYHTGFNSKYLRGYEDEMETKSVFSQALRPPMQFFRYVTMRDLGSKAIYGEKGWFFYKPGVEYLIRPQVDDVRSVMVDANDKTFTGDPIQAIVKFQNQLKELGIDLLFVLVPGKASVYPDLMNDRIPPEASGSISHSTKFLDKLANAGVETVNLFDAFAKERKKDAQIGDSLYMRKDTHWRSRGLITAARAVAERVKQYPWYQEGTTDYLIEETSIEREGDVGTMSKLPEFSIGPLRMQFETEKVPCFQVFEVKRDEAGTILQKKLYQRQSKRTSIMLIGDSFTRIFQGDPPNGAGWVAHLAAELKQPVFYDYSDGGSSTLMRQKLARNTDWLEGKKLLIWEVVERDVRFGAEGWRDVDLMTTTN